jgi:phosphatidylethanolamine/phosphatidyl-N-methylethanolamine N-methyltransferase
MKPPRAKSSYTAFAPFYDLFVGALLNQPRRASLARLRPNGGATVLLDGIGTGLDVPWLDAGHRCIGLDITRAMLEKARLRNRAGLVLVEGDVQSLPFAQCAFDYVVMHLILAVVDDPVRTLKEAVRVLKPGGTVLIFDKFLRRGERACIRRLLSPLASKVATRLDVVFEDVLDQVTGLCLVRDEPALLRGWFRRLELRKIA